MTSRARRAPRAAATCVMIGIVSALAGCGAQRAEPVMPSSPASAPPASQAAGGSRVPEDPALFGAFRRAPVSIGASTLDAAVAACRTRPVTPPADEIGSRAVVVSDARGLGVLLLVFADVQGATGCRVDTAAGGGMRPTFFPIDAGPPGRLDRGAVTLGAMRYVAEGTRELAIAVGRVGDGAVKVRAGFDDDTYVTAAMANGWYAMWWPGSIKAAIIVAADNRNVAMGTVTP